MRLSELRGRSSSTGSQGSVVSAYDDAHEQQPGTIRSAVSYQRPISALLQGHPVTLIATGDITGMSPCEKFVDENGRIDWAPSEDFTVVDAAVVPLGQDQRNRLNSGRR